MLPPILHAGSIAFLNHFLEKKKKKKIENVFLSDTEPLFNGSIQIQNAVENNIRKFMNHDAVIDLLDLEIEILIITNDGKIIYPYYNSAGRRFGTDYKTHAVEVAQKNWEIINRGLEAKVSLDLSHGTKIATLLLILYVSVSLAVFLWFYARGVRKSRAYEEEKGKRINELVKGEEAYKKILGDLKSERTRLFENIASLNSKYQESKRKARINEEEMFSEIVSLEEKLNSYIELKKDKEDEIQQLKFKLDELERRKSGQSRRKAYDFMVKRFSALYKNIEMNRKALTGFNELNEEQQIKSEEMIHQLNENPDKVPIKRKVFAGKKHKTASFEVIFAYNGRLYFRWNEEQKIEILAIGTKKTQSRDMDFLHNV